VFILKIIIIIIYICMTIGLFFVFHFIVFNCDYVITVIMKLLQLWFY